jgi:aspartyl/asparaginyl beta-hydroxylase (cupin superfamily)
MIKNPEGSYFWDNYIQEVPICKTLLENQETIKQEVLSILDKDLLAEHPNYSYDGSGKTLYEKYWKAIPLTEPADHHHPEYRDYIKELLLISRMHMPKTYSLIEEFDKSREIISAMVSKVIPGSYIRQHTEPVEYMKVHLPIICDPKCKMLVNDQTNVWEEGKLLCFNGGEMHGVSHEGTNQRVVLSIDLSLNYLIKYVPELKNAYSSHLTLV